MPYSSTVTLGHVLPQQVTDSQTEANVPSVRVQRPAFGATTRAKSDLSPQEIRDGALDAVVRRAEDTTRGLQHGMGHGRMEGKVGIVTGVGPAIGIGTAAARIYAREGARHIYLLDYVDRDLPALIKDIQATYPATKLTAVRGDAADPSLIRSLVQRALDEQGQLDFFFANAGISQVRVSPYDSPAPRGMDDIEADEFTEVMRVNALGPFLAIKYAAPAMAKLNPDGGKAVPGGSIVLTASVAGKLANAGPMPYSASKASVISLAQTAPYELVAQNVRVNAICPGLIQTDMTRGAFDLARALGKEARMGTLNPLLRQGLPHEVAETAVWLSGDGASYVNGQAWSVDGGLTASMPYIRAKL